MDSIEAHRRMDTSKMTPGQRWAYEKVQAGLEGREYDPPKVQSFEEEIVEEAIMGIKMICSEISRWVKTVYRRRFG